jgi:tetratricopeptide (TPR) repeat protein
VTRCVLVGFFLAILLVAQEPKPPAPPATQEQEPPEEDPDLKPKEYSFNPLEASRNIIAGNFYFKKGNYRAASRRYLEASKWDPTSAEALLKLGEADEKMRDFPAARQAYEKYLTVASDAKDLDAVKKKIAALPTHSGKSRAPKSH